MIDVKVFTRDDTEELSPGVNQLVRVYVAQRRKIMQGDKMAGRHGNKGVISKVLPIEDMPYMPDGTPVQIVLNPLGVPSRMNIGQILETHLGMAASMLVGPDGKRMRVEVPVFDSAKESEIDELMKLARTRYSLGLMGYDLTTNETDYVMSDETRVDRMLHYLNAFEDAVITQSEVEEMIAAGSEKDLLKRVKAFLKSELEDPNEVPSDEELEEVIAERTLEERLARVLDTKPKPTDAAQVKKLADFITRYRTIPSDYKTVLFDGRSGEAYDRRVTVGQMYVLKLAHLVDDKIHARSTGPYSLITQQPLGGKAQFGGQRFGEMEVWALEAYGAAYTLQELLTVKSDDVIGRVKTYESIVKGENVLEPGVPESFKVLIKELQSLCLDVRVKSFDRTGDLREVEIKAVEESDVKSTARELGLDLSQEALSSL